MVNHIYESVVTCLVLDQRRKTRKRRATRDDYAKVMRLLASGVGKRIAEPFSNYSTWEGIAAARPKWNARRDAHLRVLVRANYDVPTIAILMERCQKEIDDRCRHLGLVKPKT